jgi:hypothetical protein
VTEPGSNRGGPERPPFRAMVGERDRGDRHHSRRGGDSDSHPYGVRAPRDRLLKDSS